MHIIIKATHKKVEVPSRRDYLGNISSTLKQENHLELVLGDKSRSGQQWDIWEATYSPQGKDGYPVTYLGQIYRRYKS